MRLERIRRRVAALICGCALPLASLPAAAQPAIDWQCSAVGDGAAALWPADRLAGAVNRFAGLYSTRVLGLVQANERIYLLGTGGFLSRLGLRAEVTSTGPAGHEFVSQFHDFQLAPAAARAAAGYLCLREPDAGRHGLARDGQGEVVLAPGASVVLFDPADPGVTVELRAAANSPMRLRDIAALGGRMGVYAGLMRSRGQQDARIAVQGADGRIAFRSAPEASPAMPGGGAVTLAVALPETPVPRPLTAPEPAATPASEHARPQPAAVPAQADVSAAAPEPPATNAYDNALRKLRERQGTGGVRSVSALTQVHPAVDAFRNLTR